MKRNFEGSFIPNNDDQNQNASTSGQHLPSTSNPNQPCNPIRHQEILLNLPRNPYNTPYPNRAVPPPQQTGARNQFDAAAVRGNISHSQQFRHQTSWNTCPTYSYANQQHYIAVRPAQTQADPYDNQQGLDHQHYNAQTNVEQSSPTDLCTRQIRPAQPATTVYFSQYASQQQAPQHFEAEHSVHSQFTGNVFRNCNFNTAGHDINQNNSQGNQPPTEESKVAAIKRHQKEHIKNLPESVVLYDETLKPSHLPDVHPGMHAYEAYKGESPVEKEKFIPSTRQEFASPPHKQLVSFDTLLNLTTRKKFITLVGPPGSGKTTLSKRLAKLSQENQSAMFLLRFMDLNYEQPLTCKQLFVDYLCPGLNDETKENAFQWMIENQDKCVFVFDGFDQTSMSVENLKPTNVDYQTPMAIDQLVANLCCKKFFKDSVLLFTSRPHKILKIPSELRPDVTVHVDDLLTEDMEKLFRALAGDRADELWKMVLTKAPQLFVLCHNPLLLQFIIFAILHGGINKVKTVTEVFQTVLEQLRYSDHVHNRDIAKLWKPLGKMAHEGMHEGTVVFNTKSLGDLKAADVQDIIIAFARKFGFPSQRLFDGDQLFYFSHQTLQEMFSAKYICELMSDEEFHKIIPEVVEGGHWSMVRRFLCGLLLGDKKGMQTTSCKTADQLSTKRQAFREKLVEYMKTDVREFQLIDLLTDLQECSDDEKDFLASNLPVKFYFTGTPISSSAAHALADILPRLNRTVEELNLGICNLNSDTLRLICGGINKMKHGMEYLALSGNGFGNPGVEIISGCLRKVKRLDLWDCGISDDGIQILYRKLERLGLPRSTVDFD